MFINWSPHEGAYEYLCIYGCRESGFRTKREAELAYDRHDCSFVSFPEDS